MDIRPLTETFAVSPQIQPEDIPAIKAAGYNSIICNRPCHENPPGLASSEIEKAAKAAGIGFYENKFDHSTFSAAHVEEQSSIVEGAEGPVLAYCATGTRCTICWAHQMRGSMTADEIITTAANYGYDLRNMRAQL